MVCQNPGFRFENAKPVFWVRVFFLTWPNSECKSVKSLNRPTGHSRHLIG